MDFKKCNHCNNKTKMELKIDYKQNEYEIDEDERPFLMGETKWNLYECPICNQVTILSLYQGFDTQISSEEFETITKLIYPLEYNTIEVANDDMPQKVKDLYNEARNVFSLSPKSAAALLRLALQILCKEFGEKGDKVHDDIGKLVKKGLEKNIQKALDIIRIVGNNGVHPGKINLDDNPEMAYKLFGLLNTVVNTMITQTKSLDLLYNEMPEGEKQGIIKRDKNNGKSK